MDIIRAWKDQEYRAGLSAEEQTLLPDNPVGTPLSDEELEQVGGTGIGITWATTTTITITSITNPWNGDIGHNDYINLRP